MIFNYITVVIIIRFLNPWRFAIYMLYIDREILDEIDERRERLLKSAISSSVTRYLEAEANAHSDKIENPGSRRKKRKQKKEITIDTLLNLDNAWKFAVSNFDGTLNPALICDIVTKIEPDNIDIKQGYRKGSVRIQDEKDMTVFMRPEKIHGQLIQLCDLLSTDMHPVEKAALAHFHVARIHPFEDGNGRTARLVQNLFLQYEHYPPSILVADDKFFYFSLLKQAMSSYIERDAEGKNDKITPCETAFNNYVASRVNAAGIEAQKMIGNMRVYEVHLNTTEKHTIFGVKRRFEIDFRSGSRVGHVNISDLNEGYLRITGNVSSEYIGSVISAYPGYKGQPEIFRK